MKQKNNIVRSQKILPKILFVFGFLFLSFTLAYLEISYFFVPGVGLLVAIYVLFINTEKDLKKKHSKELNTSLTKKINEKDGSNWLTWKTVVTVLGHPVYTFTTWISLAKEADPSWGTDTTNVMLANPILWILALIAVMLVRFEIYRFFVSRKVPGATRLGMFSKFTDNCKVQIVGVPLMLTLFAGVEGNVMGFLVLPLFMLASVPIGIYVFVKNFKDMMK